jgi:multimeric flavodoxin WrbA
MNPERIRVLGICASPRQGNSLFLLQKSLEAVKRLPNSKRIEIEQVDFKGLKMAPCTSCEGCVKTKGECVIQDGFQSLRDQWVRADIVLYSVPVYHLGIPGQLKCFIDRLGNSQRKVYPVPYPRRLKVVGAITQGSHLFAGQELAIAFLHQHTVLLNCIPVSGDGWESYLGAAGWTRAKKEPDALAQEYSREELDARVAVRACETLVRRCVEMALIVKVGGRALKGDLAADPAYGPFLGNLQDADSKYRQENP